jgi:hypothetical protein
MSHFSESTNFPNRNFYKYLHQNREVNEDFEVFFGFEMEEKFKQRNLIMTDFAFDCFTVSHAKVISKLD